VHISTDALKATYGPSVDGQDEAASMRKVLRHIDEGRLISLQQWLTMLKSS